MRVAAGRIPITRRQVLASFTGALAASRLRAQKKGAGPAPRATPALCLFSDVLKVDYNDMGGFLQMMGFDGVELSVAPGGHIPLEGDIDLHLERAIEAMTGSGVEVPVLSTTVTSAQSKELRTIMGWGSEMGVPLFSPGQWPNRGDGMASMSMAQREISMLAQLGRAAQMQIALHNATPNFVGSSISDLSAAIRPFDATVGFNFDVGYAAAYSAPPGDAEAGRQAWLTALRLALPRLKMATARDCAWTKTPGGPPQLTECPLGEGMVDWPQFFAALADARFTGPITLQVGYAPKDALAAVRKDLAFLKKQRAAAYNG
jgi:sugar phosphate isomerase/epimerase